MIDGSGHGGHGGAGMDIGHASGFGNADLDLGHGHHDKGHFGGHHGGHNWDGKVTVEALMVAHSHAGVPNFGGFGHVNATVDAHSGMPDHGHVDSAIAADGVDRSKHLLRSEEAFLKAVDDAQHDPLRRLYGAHVVSHGWLDLPRIITELGTHLGAIRVCGTTGNFNPTDIYLNELTDWSKFTGPFSRRRPPAGWYPKASGLTHIWRQYWQVGPKKRWWRRQVERPIFDRSQSTYIEVNIVTWFYAAIGDYETRLDIKVVSLPVLDQYDKRWGVRGNPLKAHQDLAQGLTDGIFKELKDTHPSTWAEERRGKLIQLQTTRPEEVEQSGADLDTLFSSLTAHKPSITAASVPPPPAPGSPPATDKASGLPPAESTPPKVGPTPAPQLTGEKVNVKVEIPPPVLRKG